MTDHEVVEEISLRNVLSGFVSSYVERDQSMAFSNWLAGRLRQEIPDMSKKTSEKLAGEIIEAVAAYDRTLDELNTAIDAGQSREEWFEERLAETYSDMSLDAVGKELQQIENAFLVSDIQLMQGIDNTQADEINNVDYAKWDADRVRHKVYEIEKQVALTGVAAAANVLKETIQSDGTANVADVVIETLQDGLKKDSGEVKAVVAGAVKVAAEKGLEDFLPEDTSVETVCDMAGAAVESAAALFDAANRDCTTMEAIDRISSAGIAAGCRVAGRKVKGAISKVPVVGPVLVDLAGGLIEHLESPKFVENVKDIGHAMYKTVRDAAADTWKGIKESIPGKIVTNLGKVLMGGLKKLLN